MAEINKRTGLVTISLGSGSDADVMFVFANDICGESERTPRHARTYADLATMYAQIEETRTQALRSFRDDVASGSFPDESETVGIAPEELSAFVAEIDDEQHAH